MIGLICFWIPTLSEHFIAPLVDPHSRTLGGSRDLTSHRFPTNIHPSPQNNKETRINKTRKEWYEKHN